MGWIVRMNRMAIVFVVLAAVACGGEMGDDDRDASSPGMDAALADASEPDDADPTGDTGLPVCGEIGDACTGGSDCCFGLLCAEGRCLCFRAGDTAGCGATLPDGTWVHAYCCSRHATPVPDNPSDCACSPSQLGERCTADADCAVGVCTEGACTSGTCPAGFADCNGDPADGCEVALASPTDCGACENVCPAPVGAHTVPACSSAACSFACDEGWDDCNADPSDGCETDLTGGSNCGACGVECTGALCEAGGCCLGNGRGCGSGLSTPCCPGLFCNGMYCTRTSCAREGAACIAGSQCCSDTCREGQCCSRLGGACASASDCCDGTYTCNAGRCCVAPGDPCTDSFSCCAGYCAGGRCT